MTPPDLRARLEAARLDTLALLRALDHAGLAPAHLPPPHIHDLYELAADNLQHEGGGRGRLETATMKTVTLEVASREDVTRRALEAFRGKKQRARSTPSASNSRCAPPDFWRTAA